MLHRTDGPSLPVRVVEQELLVATRSTNCYSVAMAKTIPQRELRNDNAHVIDAVVSGETFVVTRNGVPVAEIGPIRSPRRSFVPKSDVLAIASNGPHIDFKQFQNDLDRVIDQSL